MKLRFVLLALLLAGASASTPVVPDLLSLFDANYTAPAFLRSELAALQFDYQAALSSDPGVYFEESVRWDSFGDLNLNVALGAEVTLFDSLSAPRSALLSQELALAEAELAADLLAARISFVREASSLALLREVALLASSALASFTAEVMQPPQLASAFEASPRDRELLELYSSVVQLERYARSGIDDITFGLATNFGVSASSLPPAVIADFVAELPPQSPQMHSCAIHAPALKIASLQHHRTEAKRALASSTDVSLQLNGQAGYSTTLLGGGSALSPSGPRLAIALEGVVRLPDTWPVSGEVSASVASHGATQSLRVRWPRTDRMAFEDEPVDPLVAASAMLNSQLVGLNHSKAQAEDALAAAELALLWLARDAAPMERSLAELRQVAQQPFADPIVEMYAVGLRADVLFAQLNLVNLALDAQLLCGSGPLG